MPRPRPPLDELLGRLAAAHEQLKCEIDALATWSSDAGEAELVAGAEHTPEPQEASAINVGNAAGGVAVVVGVVGELSEELSQGSGEAKSEGAESSCGTQDFGCRPSMESHGSAFGGSSASQTSLTGSQLVSQGSRLVSGGRRMSRVSVNSVTAMPDSPPLLGRPGWEFADGYIGKGRATLQMKGTFSEMMDDDAEEEQHAFRAWSPDSVSRTVFDAVALLMLIYDAFVVPYILAWDVKEQGFLLVCVWITRGFWTIDLPLNLITGYRTSKYRLELRPMKTATYYLRTAFLPDCALVVMDWLGGLSSNSDFRPIRLLKLVRGMRQVIRAAGLMQKFKLSMNLKEVNMAMDIAVLLLVMCWVNHVVCCAWYGIGKLANDERSTWLSELPDNSEGVITQSYEYSTSLHWAFTQMTPASMEVVPRCSLERAFTVGIIFVGLVLGSSLIATITSIMTQYRLALEDSSKKFHQLQTFLSQQEIEPNLGMAIKMQVLAQLHEKQRLRMAEVHHLGLTSRSIRDMLKYHSGIRYFGRHTFLATMDVINQAGMQSLISRTSGCLQLAKNDLVFEDGSPGDRMFFPSYGRLCYCPGERAPEMVLRMTGKPDPVLSPGDWCGEAALWTMWTHLGTLEAMVTSDVLWLAAPDLQAELGRHADLRTLVMDYSRAFLLFSNQPGTRRTDLVPTVDTQEIMSLLSHLNRLAIAKPVLEQLRAKSTVFSRNKYDRLDEEVKLGKCFIGHVDGELMRSVFVVAVRLQEDPHGRFLVKIADVPREAHVQIKPSCNMPGSKISGADRDPVDVLHRVLMTDLAELQPDDVRIDFADPSCVSKKSFVQDSPSFGIRTHYLRTTFNACLGGSVELRKLPAPQLPWNYASRRRGSGDGTGLFNASRPSCHSLCAARRRSRGERRLSVQQSEEQALDVLLRHEELIVIRCTGDSKCDYKLYLWLTDDELAALTTEHAKPILQRWLLQLDGDELRRKGAEVPEDSAKRAQEGALGGTPPSKGGEMAPPDGNVEDPGAVIDCGALRRRVDDTDEITFCSV